VAGSPFFFHLCVHCARSTPSTGFVEKLAWPCEGRARTLLAWEEIDDDDESKQRLEESQRKLLAHNLGRAERDLKEAIWRSYRHIYLLGKDNKLKEVDLGVLSASVRDC
jgi:hypothetical protein